MDRITHQSPRQRGYGSTSSLRNDSLKHTRKHEIRKERIEPKSKAAKLWRTIRPGGVDCPHKPCGLSGRVSRTVRTCAADRPKPRPTKTQSHNGSKVKTSKNTKNTRRTLCARTVRQALADRPRGTNRTENCPTPKVNTPNPSPDLPNGRSC
jgi:hypothetical protein